MAIQIYVARAAHVQAFPRVEGQNMRIFRYSAFSLVEAMVAGTVFSIAVTGVFASLSAVQQPSVTTDKSLGAAYCGQQFLESLRAAVDARDWTTGKLKVGSGSDMSCSQNGVTYTINYTITQVDTARKATVSVTWP